MKKRNIVLALFALGIISVYLPTTNATLLTSTSWNQKENTIEKNNNPKEETKIEDATPVENNTSIPERKENTSQNTTQIESKEINTKREETSIVPQEEMETKEEDTNVENNTEIQKEEIETTIEEISPERNTIRKEIPTITKPLTRRIQVIDKSKGNYCAQAIEYFYEDNEYIYYFTCIKSNSMYVIINETEYKLTDALKNGIITMKELNEAGYNFNKITKNNKIM